MSKICKCPACGAEPVKETQPFMMGKVQDGGYSITIGRYHCPQCGFGPSWGQSYAVEFESGWEKNAEVWEEEVDRVMTYVEPGAEE